MHGPGRWCTWCFISHSPVRRFPCPHRVRGCRIATLRLRLLLPHEHVASVRWAIGRNVRFVATSQICRHDGSNSGDVQGRLQRERRPFQCKPSSRLSVRSLQSRPSNRPEANGPKGALKIWRETRLLLSRRVWRWRTSACSICWALRDPGRMLDTHKPRSWPWSGE